MIVSEKECPTISIIIPAYNMEGWIAHTLLSVTRQTFTDFECIVVDDGSTDNTAKEVLAFKDSRIRLVIQANRGVSSARNYGLSFSKGNYIAFLDADDLWHPKALEVMFNKLEERKDCALVSADFLRFEDVTGKLLPFLPTKFYRTGNAWMDMIVDNYMPFGTFLVRALEAKKHSFDAALSIGEDRDWLLRLLKNNKACEVPFVVFYYRQRSGSAIRDYNKFILDENAMMEKHLKDTSLPSKIINRSRVILKFHSAVLLAKMPREKIKVLYLLLHCVLLSPLYFEPYFRICKKIYFLIAGTPVIDEVLPYLSIKEKLK